jgi:hypothetical protein
MQLSLIEINVGPQLCSHVATFLLCGALQGKNAMAKPPWQTWACCQSNAMLPWPKCNRPLWPS